MNPKFFIAAIVISVPSVVGCGTQMACTEIGCSDELKLNLTSSAGELQPGAYTLSLTLDGAEQTCTFDLDLNCSGGPCTQNVACPGGTTVEVIPGAENLSAEGLEINLHEAPTEVAFTASLDGTQVGNGTVQPSYETVQPNGADCEPTCHQGTAAGTL